MPVSDGTPPHNLDAEASVLGAMLVSPKAIAAVMDVLIPEDFFQPEHGRIFEAVLALFRREEPVDPITVADELKRLGLLNEIGGKVYLAELIDSFSTIDATPGYAKIVLDYSRLRGLIAAGAKVQEIAYALPGDVEAARSQAEQILYSAIVSQRTSRRPTSLAQVARSIVEEVGERERVTEAEGSPGFDIGLPKVDKTIGGVQPGMYVMIGARASRGKTSLLLQAIDQAARRGKNVLHFSLEMPRKQVYQRLLAQRARVAVHHLVNPSLISDEGITSLVKAASEAPNIWITDGQFTIEQILSEVRRAQIELGGLDVVSIDYVQLIDSIPGDRRTRDQQIGEMSRALKNLANETGVIVLAAAQLSRQHESDKRLPTLRDLRDSGSLEQDPDIVLLLHRLKSDLTSMFPTEFIVAKNRNGPTGSDECVFLADLNLFEEV